MTEKQDLVVIGGGSGGVAAARRAAALGAKVTLIERDRLGGTCVMRGCVPKKLMLYAAQFGAELRDAAAFGWQVDNPRFDLAVWQQNKTTELARLEDIYRELLQKSGVHLISGDATLTGPDTVGVNGASLQTARILIATGGTPNRNAFPGIEHAMTSDELLARDNVPGSLGVIGGGYVGLEFACIMAGLGAQVSVFYREQLPLRGFDHSMREHVVDALTQQGITLIPETRFARVTTAAHRQTLLANGRSHEFDAILNATGRSPTTSSLGLEGVGIVTDKTGAIPVDAFSQTTVKGIFAIGDVTNRKNLTPVAIAEGRAFAENAFNGQQLRIDYDSVATAAFLQPPLASVGLSEEAACARGRLRIYEAAFRPMKTAFAGGSQKAYMKLIVEDSSDRVLGIHMLGPDAPEILQALSVAFRMGATKADLDRTMAVHPTIAEEFMLMHTVSRVTG